MTQFLSYIQSLAKKNNSSVIVGFDPNLTAFPKPFIQKAKRTKKKSSSLVSEILRSFYCESLDVLSADICGVKPNSAFFEQYGVDGMAALQEILLYARRKKIPTILDAKRGDIGSTAAAYASAAFSTITFDAKKIIGFPADSLTINPFLGFDTLEPFVNVARKEKKGLFVLLATSNPGSSDIQEKVRDTVARWVLKQHEAGFHDIGVVVGATLPEKITHFRSILPKTLFLIPGVGAQGGTPADVVSAFTGLNEGALINSSRGIFTFRSQDKTVSQCLDTMRENTRGLKSALNYAQQFAGPVKATSQNHITEYEAEVMLHSAFDHLKNIQKLKKIRDKQIGDFWNPSWIRAPFEECLTFKQITDIGYENLIKKRSMNAEKMVALSNAIETAVKARK